MEEHDRRGASAVRPTVETVITARDGKYTYRVLAYRPLAKEECKKVVWRALAVGAIAEPAPGETTTLTTGIGRRESDEPVDPD